ncbi:hypothetical protein [Succinimonas amylolytica]|uniref:hypothetical protein n=1 Tax=Succinimonas amylolytica TaxID=83769 RepID=UPI00036256B7|nr:hypothetical protein [Succinimonas amylolytica]
MANKKYLLFTFFVLIIHIVLAMVYANNQIIGSSQNLLLTNAYDALYNGKFSSFGDSFPGIGPTPGILPTLLSYTALTIWDTPLSIMALIIILRILAFIILSACLKKYFSNITMCWFSVFFLLSPFILYNTTLTQDAFFLFGVAAVTASYVMLRKATSFQDIYSREITFTYDRKGWTFFGTIVMILGLFWCVETDYLGLIMVFLTLFMYMRRLLTFSFTGASIGFFIGGMTIYPFLQELTSNNTLTGLYAADKDHPVMYGLTNIYPLAISVFDFLRLGSTNFSHYLVTEFNSGFISGEPVSRVLNTIWVVVLYALGGVTLLLNIASWSVALKQCFRIAFDKHKVPNKREYLYLVSFYTFFALVLTAAIYSDKLPLVTLGAILPLALIPALTIVDGHRQNNTSMHFTILTGAIIFLTVINLGAAVSSGYFDSNASLSMQLTEEVNAILSEMTN